MTQGLDMPDGKPREQRQVDVPASPLATLITRPVRNLLELRPPGPAAVQHHVDVPARPEEGTSR
jgi:hypothetical protein